MQDGVVDQTKVGAVQNGCGVGSNKNFGREAKRLSICLECGIMRVREASHRDRVQGQLISVFTCCRYHGIRGSYDWY